MAFYANDPSRSEISNALAAKLKHSRGDGPGLPLDRLDISTRYLLEGRVQLKKRETVGAFGLSKIKDKYTVLNPDYNGSSHLPLPASSQQSFAGHAFNPSAKYNIQNGNRAETSSASNKLTFNLKPPQEQNHHVNKNVPAGPSCRQDDNVGLAPPKTVLFDPSEVQLNWGCVRGPGAGFHNTGNTCYLNSSLQALFHCPPFVNWLLHDPHFQSKGQCACLICAVGSTLMISIRNSGGAIKPSYILNNLKSICRTLSFGRQEDAHEFLRNLLSSLQLCYLKRYNAEKLDVRSQETTPIDQIFGGYIRSQVSCSKCSRRSNTYDHFQDLILDIRNVDNLQSALESYFKMEQLHTSSGYKCIRCRSVVQATKKFSIERAPNVLIIQLKRFESLHRKIGRAVSFREELDLTQFSSLVDDKKKSDVPIRYKLSGTVVHEGSALSSGHYVAVARAPDGKFYLFNDSSVTCIHWDRLRHHAAYLLFYVRVHPQPHSHSHPQSVQPSPMKSPVLAPRQAANGHESPFRAGQSVPSLNSSSVSNSNSISPAQKRPFIGPQLPNGFQTPAKVSSPSYRPSPSLNSNSNSNSPMQGQNRPKILSVERSVNELGVKLKQQSPTSTVPVALVLEHRRRLGGGADSLPPQGPVKSLVPYEEEEDEDEEEEEEEDDNKDYEADDECCSRRAAEKAARSAPRPPMVPEKPETPVENGRSTNPSPVPPVLSTHKKNWCVEDEKHQTNRSDTSADSVSSTSGRWKASTSGASTGSTIVMTGSSAKSGKPVACVPGSSWEASEVDVIPFKGGGDEKKASNGEIKRQRQEESKRSSDGSSDKKRTDREEPLKRTRTASSSSSEHEVVLSSRSSKKFRTGLERKSGETPKGSFSAPASTTPSRAPSEVKTPAKRSRSSSSSSSSSSPTRKSDSPPLRKKEKKKKKEEETKRGKEKEKEKSKEGEMRREKRNYRVRSASQSSSSPSPSPAPTSSRPREHGDDRSRTHESLQSLGGNVKSWDGGPNSLDSELARERKITEERRRADREYDDEFDRGREKKQKKKHPEIKPPDGYNRFDEFTRHKRDGGGGGSYHHRHHHNHNRPRSVSGSRSHHFHPNDRHGGHGPHGHGQGRSYDARRRSTGWDGGSWDRGSSYHRY